MPFCYSFMQAIMHSCSDGNFLLTSCYCVEDCCASKKEGWYQISQEVVNILCGHNTWSYDQGKFYCLIDPKDNDLSVETRSCLNGYIGCGLDDFDKKGEQSQIIFSFKIILVKTNGHFSKVLSIRRILFNQSEPTSTWFIKMIRKCSDWWIGR